MRIYTLQVVNGRILQKSGERARAILKLIEGKKRQLIADLFDINIGTLDTWVRNWKRKSIEGIKNTKQAGNNYLLDKKKKKQIKEILDSKTPEEVGLSGKFWTVLKLKELVKIKYNLIYQCNVSYQRLFKYCGFSFHKPNKTNKKQSSHMRKRFEETLKKRSDGATEKMAWYW
ncbi:helix-turn-helix domain-containing protein [Candidatus Gottesmanbacteria bacterium]|nr:helix-turn-helix domain-containing protein [Candidatus Gottesmanbacteria bacterium]